MHSRVLARDHHSCLELSHMDDDTILRGIILLRKGDRVFPETNECLLISEKAIAWLSPISSERRAGSWKTAGFRITSLSFQKVGVAPSATRVWHFC